MINDEKNGKKIPIPTKVATSEVRIVRPERVASMLQCSRAHVYKLAAKKKIAYIKVGTSVRFDFDDVLAFLKENRQSTNDKD